MINGKEFMGAGREQWILHTLESWLRIEHRMTLAEGSIDHLDHRLGRLEKDKAAVQEAWFKMLRGALALMAAFVTTLALNGGGMLETAAHFFKR
jgi:hypothetical protein